MQENRLSLKYFLIISSFIEGGCLMAFEVLSIKIYTPFLGASIYVWTSILTITLAGLACGYWAGGLMSKKDDPKSLGRSFIFSGALIFLSTFIAKLLLPAFINMEIRIASLLAGFLILFFPVFFMGTISPLIVKFLNRFNNNIGKSSGIIYGTGTIGGIFFVMLTVYFFIPELGVKYTSFLLGALMIVVGAVLTVYKISSANEKK
jgi:predicted membrane-bound spermidine synthase